MVTVDSETEYTITATVNAVVEDTLTAYKTEYDEEEEATKVRITSASNVNVFTDDDVAANWMNFSNIVRIAEYSDDTIGSDVASDITQSGSGAVKFTYYDDELEDYAPFVDSITELPAGTALSIIGVSAGTATVQFEDGNGNVGHLTVTVTNPDYTVEVGDTVTLEAPADAPAGSFWESVASADPAAFSVDSSTGVVTGEAADIDTVTMWTTDYEEELVTYTVMVIPAN